MPVKTILVHLANDDQSPARLSAAAGLARRLSAHLTALYVTTPAHMPAAVTGRGALAVSAPHLIARMPDHDLWMAFVNDSEGNLLGLMSEVRPPSSS